MSRSRIIIKLLHSVLLTFSLLLIGMSFSHANGLVEEITTLDIVTHSQFSKMKDDAQTTFVFNVGEKSFQFLLAENKMLMLAAVKARHKGELIFYEGTLERDKSSWARFMLKDGFVSGAFSTEGKLYFISELNQVLPVLKNNIDLAEKTRKLPTNTTVIFDADNIVHNGTCGLHDHQKALDYGYQGVLDSLKKSMLGSAASEIKITLVSDTEYAGTSTNPVIEMLSELNIVTGIFEEQLNIRIALEDTVVLSENGSLNSSDPEALIQAFRITDIPNAGVRHLFTGKDLNGTTVGIAFVGSLCYDSSVGVTQRFGSITSLIFAHELGHNFGAPHDNQSGSACESTSSGFLMNPSVSNASSFSTCSISQMNPVIQGATSGFRACITSVESLAPTIISIANTVAELGVPYQYDSDNLVNVEGDDPLVFSLDIGPEGLLLSDAGQISWTPTAENIGTNVVQLSVQNTSGIDTQLFEVEVTSEFVNFGELPITSYGGNQDVMGSASSAPNPLSITLEGNVWKSVPLNYTVSTSTMLEFTFSSDIKAEIHGIGVDNNSSVNKGSIFNIHGTQRWLNMTYRSDGSGSNQSFLIPIGLFYQGDMDRLVFAMDNDNNTVGANSVFSNVRVFDVAPPSGEVEFLDLSSLQFAPFRDNQDGLGTAQITDDGKGLQLSGNRWRKTTLSDAIIGPNTVLEFEFKSEAQGEIQGIGFVRDGNDNNEPRIFQLYGTQRWGNIDFKYIAQGSYQKFVIPVGTFFRENNVEMIFIMDHDVANPTGESSFKNVLLREQ